MMKPSDNRVSPMKTQQMGGAQEYGWVALGEEHGTAQVVLEHGAEDEGDEKRRGRQPEFEHGVAEAAHAEHAQHVEEAAIDRIGTEDAEHEHGGQHQRPGNARDPGEGPGGEESGQQKEERTEHDAHEDGVDQARVLREKLGSRCEVVDHERPEDDGRDDVPGNAQGQQGDQRRTAASAVACLGRGHAVQFPVSEPFRVRRSPAGLAV